MSEHMKRRPTKYSSNNSVICFIYGGKSYAIPKSIAARFIINNDNASIAKSTVSADKVFADLIHKHTKAGALLKGLRIREGMTQINFAKKISVTQTNLSKMENGKRPIGRTVAKRIAAKFNMDYRVFLE